MTENAEQPSQPWKVKPLQIQGLTEDLEVGEQGLTFGRDPANAVSLSSDQYPEVSQHHARVVLRDGALVLEDLESTNGTHVGGERVTRRVLHHGEVFQLGNRGPRFVVVHGEGLSDTISLPQGTVRVPGTALGSGTIRMVKEQRARKLE